MSAANFFSLEQKQKIKFAITQAERNTSGEIRVHVENRCNGDALEETKMLFSKLGMHNTAQRNGVLFFIAVKDKKFAVWSDEDINSKVPADFWDLIKNKMEEDFAKGNFTDGLILAIISAGVQLKKYFPLQENDENELSNEISF